MSKTIYVYENWSGELPKKLGKLYVDQVRGSEQYAFAYDEAWLPITEFPMKKQRVSQKKYPLLSGATGNG